MAISQAQKELSIFDAFLRAAPFSVKNESIVSRSPPEPDILCELHGVGFRYFELTELVDERFMSRTARMAVINKHLNQYWKCELPKQELDAFIRKFSDASILVSYQPFENGGPHGEQPRHPRQLSRQLFATLNSFPDGYSGMYGSGEGLQIPGIEYIRVQRTKSKGPYLQTNSFGFLSDPTESSIAKKMKKSYEAEHPVHLLAHIEFDLFAEGVEFAELIKSLRAQNQHQVFEKVWIFSSVTGSILYEENA